MRLSDLYKVNEDYKNEVEQATAIAVEHLKNGILPLDVVYKLGAKGFTHFQSVTAVSNAYEQIKKDPKWASVARMHKSHGGLKDIEGLTNEGELPAHKTSLEQDMLDELAKLPRDKIKTGDSNNIRALSTKFHNSSLSAPDIKELRRLHREYFGDYIGIGEAWGRKVEPVSMDQKLDDLINHFSTLRGLPKQKFDKLISDLFNKYHSGTLAKNEESAIDKLHSKYVNASLGK